MLKYFTKVNEIMKFENIEITITEDGSIGLYDKKLDEVYHSKFGAKKEAIEKFIEPALVLKDKKDLKILDICYGIGYNTKCLLMYFKNIKKIDCVEINKDLVLNSYKFDFDEKINAFIKDNLDKKSDLIQFHIEDIRKFIQKTDEKYDIIFHDGFCPNKQPELWSEELIFEISKKLNGIYCTYNHSKPVLNALNKANLTVGKVIKNNKTIATVASFNKNLIKNPLDDYEIGALNTKSAITYKDKNLNSSSNEIIEKRKIETVNSNLITLSHYKKITEYQK